MDREGQGHTPLMLSLSLPNAPGCPPANPFQEPLLTLPYQSLHCSLFNVPQGWLSSSRDISVLGLDAFSLCCTFKWHSSQARLHQDTDEKSKSKRILTASYTNHVILKGNGQWKRLSSCICWGYSAAASAAPPCANPPPSGT